jgi:hypothetical protein
VSVIVALLGLALAGSSSPGPSTAPLTAAVGAPSCTPSPHTTVSVANPDTTTAQSYSLYVDGKPLRTEQVDPRRTLNGTIPLTDGAATTIKVTSGGRTLAEATRTASCATASPSPSKAPGKLPLTGSGATTEAHAITALAIMAGGGILLFYAGLWPRSGAGDWSTPTRRTRS